MCREALTRKTLAQLNAPLVKAVDVPDATFGEGNMLIVCNERTKSSWANLVGQDRGRRAVAQECLVRDEIFWCTLRLDFICSFAEHKCFGLCEEVGGKHPSNRNHYNDLRITVVDLPLMLQALNRIMGFGRKDKVGGNEFGTLVKQLKEGMLCIGARLPEENWASRIVNIFAIAGDGFSIRLHGELLKICGEAVHILVKTVKNEHIYKVMRVKTYGATR